MIKGPLIHPEILERLAKSGHFSQVLIADGNYPVATGTNPLSKKVYLNLKPGLLSCLQVLEVILEAIPVQEANVMTPPADYTPDIFSDYQELLGADVEWEEIERWAFYEKIKSTNTSLVIATGEQRRFANLLLTVGVVKLESENF